MPPPRPASSDTIYIIHASGSVTNSMSMLACQYNQPKRPAVTLTFDLSFDLENGVRVTRDVGYHCADFSLLRPLCSRLRPDVHDRQTDRRQTASSLNAPA